MTTEQIECICKSCEHSNGCLPYHMQQLVEMEECASAQEPTEGDYFNGDPVEPS